MARAGLSLLGLVILPMFLATVTGLLRREGGESRDLSRITQWGCARRRTRLPSAA